jgi:hypothetical protein
MCFGGNRGQSAGLWPFFCLMTVHARLGAMLFT